MSTATELREQATVIAETAPLVEWKHPSLAAALVAALAELTVIEATRTADAGSYSYKYGDLADLVKTTRPVLAQHGLAARTPVHAYGNGLACTVKFIHEGGETYDDEPFPFPAGRDAQATGSMTTYHKRYALLSSLGMAVGDDDDDGAKAVAGSREPKGWTLEQAKAHVTVLAEGNKDRAKEAWKAIYQAPWTAEDLTAAYEAWTNAPVEEPEGESA